MCENRSNAPPRADRRGESDVHLPECGAGPYDRRRFPSVFEIWFGQFNTIDGAVQEEGPYVGIFEGDADEPDGVGVYILAEPVGGASPELCAATIEAIAGAFDAPRQALTASLLRALNAGNAYVLRHYPVEGSPDFGVGVTVLAIRRGEGYVAQAGPSLACVRGGGATRILQPAGEAAARPLGSDARITPSFARLEIQPGDSAVLLFSAGEELIGVRRLAQIVTQPPEHALPDLFLRARGEPDFAALYLSVVGERRPSAAPSTDLPVPRGVARQSPAAAVAQPAAGNVETLVVESDDPLAERRNGHSVNGTSTVRTVIPRRTPMGSMAPSALPITRRHIAIAGAVAGLAL